MQSASLAVLLAYILGTAIISGCSSSSGNQNTLVAGNNSSSVSNVVPKDNTDELTLLVSLPFEPEEVAWEESSDKKNLTAVIRFSTDNAAKMAAELAKGGSGSPETLSVESWYPAELIAQAELSGESSIKGKTYPAESFLNPPYTKGRMTQIDNTDYFILRISS
jgi:hypothetical protein